jgi:hypothetical protein
MFRQFVNHTSLAVLSLLGISACGNSGPSAGDETSSVTSALVGGVAPKQVLGSSLPLQGGELRAVSEIAAADKALSKPTRSSAPAHVAPDAPATRAKTPARALVGESTVALAPTTAPSPAPSSSFPAAEDSGWIPPDTNGAVGPNHLVVALNGRVRFQTRAGQNLNDFTLAGFFSSVDSGSGDIFDPLVRFDSLGNRFVMTAMADRSSPNSAVLIAVSQSSDPTGSWRFFRLDADPQDFGWADFPKIGIHNNWVVVSANLLGGNDPAVLFVCGKAVLYAAQGSASCRRFGTQSFSAPAIVYDASLATEYIARNLDPFSGTLAIDTITGPVGQEVLTQNAATVTFSTGWNQFGSGNFAPQSEIPDRIETDFVAAVATLVYRNGSLWGTQTAYLPAEAPTRSAIQWWQVSPTGTVQQFARIDDPSGQLFYAFPSLGVNKNNDVLLGYARFSPTQHPSGNYAFRAGTDAPNTLQGDTVLKAGETSYSKDFGSGRNRWGDYSHTMVDPVNDVDLWTIQEYAASPANTWGTWWGKIVPGTPGTTCSEATAVDLGAPANAVTVPNDGCVRVRDAYPFWWGTHQMQLQSGAPGSYPVPFTWSNACAGTQGSGTFTGNWQTRVLGLTNSACATVIDLMGSGTGTITLRYFGN